MGVNHLVMTGRIASDFRTSEVNGVTKLTFSICHEVFANGEKHPEFWLCEAWEKGAEIILKNFQKGDPITVEGPIRKESWEKDGVRKERTYIRVKQHHLHPFARRRDESRDDAEQESQSARTRNG